MGLLRYVFSLFGLIISLGCFANNPGIAFVHGTNDHRFDADGGYWQRDFINYLRESLPTPDNYWIVACDYSQFMWDEAAAGCTVDQLLRFVEDKQITELTLYTHSNGGNVIRWILSHPTYDKRYFTLSKIIKQVIALAPSSGGTILADEALDGSYFEESVGWLLGYANNSVRQQRIGDMAIYNGELLFGTEGRVSLPVPFRVVVGSDVIASPLNSASYCNGYFHNSGLKITRMYLEDCSDGFLNCSSQAAAGEVWFVDKDKTSEGITLSHNQSRHSCFGLEQILREDLQEGVNHANATTSDQA